MRCENKRGEEGRRGEEEDIRLTWRRWPVGMVDVVTGIASVLGAVGTLARRRHVVILIGLVEAHALPPGHQPLQHVQSAGFVVLLRYNPCFVETVPDDISAAAGPSSSASERAGTHPVRTGRLAG
jgi:hypothetical protein